MVIVTRRGWEKEWLEKSMFLKWLQDRDPNITNAVAMADGLAWIIAHLRNLRQIKPNVIRRRKTVELMTKRLLMTDLVYMWSLSLTPIPRIQGYKT